MGVLDRTGEAHIGNVIALAAADNVSARRTVDLVAVAKGARGIERAVILVNLGGEEVGGEVVWTQRAVRLEVVGPNSA